MTVQLSLDETQTRKLTEAAERLGVEPAEVVRRCVDEYLAKSARFDEAVSRVLSKNAELYRRLALQG